ncbi:integrase family protein [Cupriavidus taiwanensis]|uniref:tyrosine-type recombinase/integrase n=1 Tax=Cupriavidus taiwanensis TaxID=164546 RepID=UPI000E116C05|nr:integrase family protein [Cupriavidus taiwanensis]SOY48739.1 putative phage integrase; CP4-6 prophage [Cupriavidus taiwanensis]SOZ23161.1 putative phage integrase; CP4-6 prophage [Cupriavidus taiwanensis]SPA45054.1 putative phage integrase; CP4-6 prophage [Cupriavidus taiwanensis]
MAKVNFTARRVQEHTCPDGKAQAFLWDAASPGLGLRATANGAKAYIFQGKIYGQTVRLTIGDPRSWSIEKAQEKARSLQTLIDDGKDPREAKAEAQAAHEAKQAAARRKDVTLGDAWTAYIAARRGKWSERHYLDHVRLADRGDRDWKRGKTIAAPLAALLDDRLSELTRERIAAWLEKEAESRPTSAALSFRLLRAFARWCEDQAAYKGLASLDAYSSRISREHVPKAKTKDDCLQREQLPAWFAAVRAISNPVISAYLQGLLITGARREELGGLWWEDVDFQWGSLTIRDKVEGERTIPLPPYLASLLLHLKRRNDTPPNVHKLKEMEAKGEKWKPSPWVFSSPTSANGRLAEPRNAHAKALTVAGLPHVSLHGLRRSFGTLCEWVEMPSGISAQIMGHKPSALAEKHYRRRPLDLLRAWHVKIEAWLLEQAGIEFKQDQAKPGLKVIASA